jgi:hypothetical protein
MNPSFRITPLNRTLNSDKEEANLNRSPISTVLWKSLLKTAPRKSDFIAKIAVCYIMHTVSAAKVKRRQAIDSSSFPGG